MKQIESELLDKMDLIKKNLFNPEILGLNKKIEKIDYDQKNDSLLCEIGLYLNYPIDTADLDEKLNSHINSLPSKITLKEFIKEIEIFRILVLKEINSFSVINFGEKLLDSSIIDNGQSIDEIDKLKTELHYWLEGYKKIENSKVLKYLDINKFYNEIINNLPDTITVLNFNKICNFIYIAIYLEFNNIDISYLIEIVEQTTCIFEYPNDEILYINLKIWLNQMKEKNQFKERKKICKIVGGNKEIEFILKDLFNKIIIYVDYPTYENLYNLVLLAFKANLECLPFLVEKLLNVLISGSKPEEEYDIMRNNLRKIKENHVKKL